MKNHIHGIENLLLWIIGIVLTIILFLTSCKSPQLKTEKVIIDKTERSDSVSRIEREKARLVVVPQSSVSLNLNFENLNDLPIGAKYTEKQGQATVLIEKISDNDFKITANCDSLSQLIVERETEIFHLQTHINELEQHAKETKVINETTPSRWFFIYSGRLFWALVGIYLIYLILKWKKKLPF